MAQSCQGVRSNCSRTSRRQAAADIVAVEPDPTHGIAPGVVQRIVVARGVTPRTVAPGVTLKIVAQEVTPRNVKLEVNQRNIVREATPRIITQEVVLPNVEATQTVVVQEATPRLITIQRLSLRTSPEATRAVRVEAEATIT